MCLATPMEIKEILEGGKAIVQQAGVEARVDISLLESPQVGDYVIVHAGFAIEKLDMKEAEERLKLFSKLAEVKENLD